MTTSHQLSAESVSLGYDQRTVVDGLDLDVPPGRLTVIVGANACGKSTLLRGLARLLAFDEAQVAQLRQHLHCYQQHHTCVQKTQQWRLKESQKTPQLAQL